MDPIVSSFLGNIKQLKELKKAINQQQDYVGGVLGEGVHTAGDCVIRVKKSYRNVPGSKKWDVSVEEVKSKL